MSSDLKQMFQAGDAPIQRGIVRRFAALTNNAPPPTSFRFFLIQVAVIGALAGVVLSLIGLNFMYGFAAAWYVVGFVFVLPLLYWLGGLILLGKCNTWFNTYSTGTRFMFGAMLGHIIGFPFLKLMQENGVMVWLTFMALGAFFIPVLSQAFAGKQVWRGLLGAVPAPAAAPVQVAPVAHVEPARRDFALQYGVATGTFSSLGHGTGMAPNSPVTLSLADAATNTIIFGGIGSGKTTRMINPLLMQVLSQDAGALIFDIKTNFIQTTDYLAAQAGREYRIVGEGGMPFNLLQGLTPEVAASFLKSAILLSEGKSSGTRFWLDGAVEFCRNGLGLLIHIPERYL